MNKMLKKEWLSLFVIFFFITTLTFSLGSCGGGDGGGGAIGTVDVSGYWEMYYTSNLEPEEIGPVYLSLMQSDSTIAGIYISGSGDSQIPMYGDINGTSISLAWPIDTHGSVVFVGQVNNNMSGTWSSSFGDADLDYGTWWAERIDIPPLTIPTQNDFSGSWNGYIRIEGTGHPTTLTLDSNLSGSYVVTGQSRVDIHNIMTGFVEKGVLSFTLSQSDLDIGNPDCVNWNMQCIASLSQDFLTMYLSCAGTVCSGKEGVFLDILNKQ